MVNEDVAVFIIKSPFMNLTTGALMNYEINYTVKYNYLFWPDKTDVIRASL